jgi:hypothetical protein
MKNLFIGMLLASMMGVFFACQKDNLVTEEADLVNTIAFSAAKESVDVADLPSGVSNYVEANFAPLSIDEAFYVRQHGYEVAVEDGTYLYFAERGNCLNPDGGMQDRGGRNRCLRGDSIAVADLPQAISDYVSANFSGETIESAVVKPNGYYGVGLSGGTVLLFDADGNFLRECDGRPGGGHGGGHGNPGGCARGDSIDVADLPQAVTDYVTTNYAGETITVAVLKPSGKYAVELSGGKVLIFDEEGTFIRECGSWGGGGGHHGHGHGGGSPITVDDLPQAAQDYLTATYPDATVERAAEKRNGNFIVKLSNGEIVLFDSDGNVIFDSGN